MLPLQSNVGLVAGYALAMKAKMIRPTARVAAVLMVAAASTGPASAFAQATSTQPDAAVPAIDAARLMADLSVLAADSMEGRQVGTPGSERARAFIVQRFQEIGLQPLGEAFTQPFTISGRGGEQRTGVNIVGMVRGATSPDRYIVVSAHYDHLGVRDGSVFNGADDNASGTAGLLAIASHFQQNTPAHSLIFVAFDAEEGGLHGAHAFVADPPVPADAIALNVNLDMIARGDNGVLWAVGTYHYPQLEPFVARIAESAPVDLRMGHDSPEYRGSDNWTSASDHGPFHAVGIPFIYFGVEDHPDYHRPTDDFDKVDADFYARSVRTILSALMLLDREYTE